MTARKPALRLSTVDLERHARMVGLVEEARRLQAQAQEHMARAAKLKAAVDVWAEELAERYHLGDDGQVLEDGTIVRRAK